MDIPTTVVTEGAQETQELGQTLGFSILTEKGRGNLPHLFCLWGELGSGKTTFVQGFARGLGITGRLLSPTFIIVRRYQIPKQSRFLLHLDLYRIQKEVDMRSIGFEEMISDPDMIVVVEWPERLGYLLPKKRIDCHFVHRDENVRSISITFVK